MIKKLFTASMIMLATYAQGQRTGVNWPGGYYFTGPFSIGVNQQGTGNDAAFPGTSAMLRIGPDSGNKGMQPARGLDTANVPYPRPLGLQFFQNKDSSYYEWLGSSWRALSNRPVDSTKFTTHYQTDTAKENLRNSIAGKVPNSRTINGKALSSNITLTTDDIGEGSLNRYFTVPRVRSALSAGSGINFDTNTGVISATGSGGAGNLVLNKTTGGQVSYNAPNGYVFDISTLYADELAGTITKVSETYPPAPIPYPAGWSWKPAIPLRYNDGTIGSSMTPDDFRARYAPKGKTYYAAPSADGGASSNDGLSPATPLTLEAAYEKTDVVEIVVKPGYYTAMNDFPAGTVRKTLSVRCPGGKAYLGSVTQTDAFRHLDATGTPGLWYSEYAGANGLVRFDMTDTFGNYVPLRKVFTEAEMLSTENTYYIYGYPAHGMQCHLPVSFTPSNLVNSMLIETGATGLLDVIDDGTIVNQTVYLENIVFAGQVLGRMNAGCKVYAQGCSFLYAQNDGDELTFAGGEEVILYQCNFGYCRLDASSFTSTSRAALLECNGIYANLYGENLSNQISTAHSGTVVVRIGGNYFYSEYAIVDVTGSRSFNAGIKSKSTVSAPFQMWDGAAHGYFIDCSTDHTGGTYGARNTAVTEVQGSKQTITANPQAGGTLKFYGFSLN